jgi:ligand-binding sensor domain-containing protein
MFIDGRFISYVDMPKVKDYALVAFGEDRDGNLWIGTYGSGALKLARNGFTSFGKSDGLEGVTTHVYHIFETPAGELGIITRAGHLYRFDGTRFIRIHAQVAAGAAISHVLRDQAGDYWISTSIGLYRH